jgi:phage terminase large subunit-like protein
LGRMLLTANGYAKLRERYTRRYTRKWKNSRRLLYWNDGTVCQVF